MVIRVDEEYNIVEAASIGGDKDAPNCYEINDIPIDIVDDIFSYKYINGQFIKKSDTDSRHIATAKDVKIKFLSDTCASVIEAGIDIGDDHYSLTYADQINLSKLASQAVMSPQLPIFYHADGKLCRQYTPEEILYIAQVAVAWVTYHTTYYNFAKAYVKTMDNFETVRNFKYGMTLSEDLEEQLEAILETTHVTFTEIIDDPYDYDQILYPERGLRNNALMIDSNNPFFSPIMNTGITPV